MNKNCRHPVSPAHLKPGNVVDGGSIRVGDLLRVVEEFVDAHLDLIEQRFEFRVVQTKVFPGGLLEEDVEFGQRLAVRVDALLDEAVTRGTRLTSGAQVEHVLGAAIAEDTLHVRSAGEICRDRC